MLLKGQMNGGSTAAATAQQPKPRPWFNLLPRQPCATATTKLSDLKAHLEAAERERIMSQIQVALQGNSQLSQLSQMFGGQITPELLMIYSNPQLLQQLTGTLQVCVSHFNSNLFKCAAVNLREGKYLLHRLN